MDKKREINVVKTFKRTIEKRKIDGTEYAFFWDTVEGELDGKISISKKSGLTLIKHIDEAKGLEDIKTQFSVDDMRGYFYAYIMKKNVLDGLQAGKINISCADVQPIPKLPIDGDYCLSDDEVLVLWNTCTQLLADANQNLIPLPMRFCNEKINDYNYDLNALFEFLKSKEGILNKGVLELKDIPHYSLIKHGTQYADFCYLPTPVEYKLIQMDKYNGGKYHDDVTMADEIIGLKQFRKIKI